MSFSQILARHIRAEGEIPTARVSSAKARGNAKGYAYWGTVRYSLGLNSAGEPSNRALERAGSDRRSERLVEGDCDELCEREGRLRLQTIGRLGEWQCLGVLHSLGLCEDVEMSQVLETQRQRKARRQVDTPSRLADRLAAWKRANAAAAEMDLYHERRLEMHAAGFDLDVEVNRHSMCYQVFAAPVPNQTADRDRGYSPHGHRRTLGWWNNYATLPTVAQIAAEYESYLEREGRRLPIDAWLAHLVGSVDGPLVDPRWRTCAVIDLAAAIAAERAFGLLPILADALEDAGCDSDVLIRRLRAEGAKAEAERRQYDEAAKLPQGRITFTAEGGWEVRS